jgi:TonB family protein
MRWSRLAALALASILPATRPAAAQPADPAPAAAVAPPRPLAPLTASYPAGGKGDARVLLVIGVNADGTVRFAKVAEGEEPFGSAAVAASSEWRFDPATRGGKPVAAAIRAEIHFVAPVVESDEPLLGPLGPAAPKPPSIPLPAPKPREKPQPIEVTVRGEQPAPGAVSMSRAEVRLLPGAFGDPFRAVELLPGVTPIASGVPFFFVRGAPPGNVGYFLDGVRVPLLFHLGLGPSVIHPALMDRVDLYPGGYPAQYGRFAGGIIAGETRDPEPVWHGEANLRLVDAGAMAEAPFDGGRGSALASGRYSYTAALFSLLQSSIDLRYWDYQARVGYDVTPRDRVSVFAFGAYDFLGQKNDGAGETVVFDTTFHRVDLRYDHRFGPGSTLRQAITLGWDQTRLGEGRYARDRQLAARTEIQHRLSGDVLLRAGADASFDGIDVDLTRGTEDQDFAALFKSHMDLAVGLRADVVWQAAPNLEVTPGLRVDLFGGGGLTAIGVDPRLAARVTATRWLRFLPALGVATQPPSFLVSGPGFTVGLGGGLQRSAQASVGAEMDLPLEVTGTFTTFYNTFFNMTDALGTSRTSASDFSPAFGLRSTGVGTGIEIALRRRLTKRLGGFFSYTLSRSDRTVVRPVVVGVLPLRVEYKTTRAPSSYDRTHVLNAAVTYDFGKGYRAGGRVVVYSGIPLVRQGEAPGFEPTVDGRLSPFFRLDVRAEKRWTIGRGWLSLVLEVQNATLTREQIGTSCPDLDPKHCVAESIGPVTIPSLGLEGGL